MAKQQDGASRFNPKLNRRTLLGALGITGALAFLTTAGQTIPQLAPFNLFGSHQQRVGPQHLPVNKTAKKANVIAKAKDPKWRLSVRNGAKERTFTLRQLQRLPQHTVTLPISCVEGWSVNAVWAGVRFADLAKLVGASDRNFKVQSLQRGAYATTTLENNFVRDPLTLIALRVNGQELDLDHGYPARLIAPARPGVLQTKWLEYIEAQ